MKLAYVLSETACAEQGSALEMLSACKNSDNPSLAAGYFSHSKDEYNHASTFWKILKKRVSELDSMSSRQYRFKPESLLAKGYVSRDGFLVEKLSPKDFVAFVYVNELLAKSSFDKIHQYLEKRYPEDAFLIEMIMKDELRHHGMAKSYFIKHYPRLQPFHLSFYKLRETLKNKSRKLYDKNLKLLDRVFLPIYSLVSYSLVPFLNFIDLKQYDRDSVNLMSISPRSVL